MEIPAEAGIQYSRLEIELLLNHWRYAVLNSRLRGMNGDYLDDRNSVAVIAFII